MRPVGNGPSLPHQSEPLARTSITGEETIRSGSPTVQVAPSGHSMAGGMSAGLPRGAPASTQSAIRAISSLLSEMSFLKRWMPTFFSMNQGGIRSGSLSGREVLSLIARAQGRTSS